MKKINYILFAACLLAVFISIYSQAYAWDTDTHIKMNNSAIEYGAFWGTLDKLCFNIWYDCGDLYSHITEKMVKRWIRKGGAVEDSAGRYIYHFHDPLMPWEQAGLNIPLFPRALSSVVWAQLPRKEQGTYAYSWHDAREYYYKALTGVASADREYWFEKTFKALGQIMHLVEDAAVPDHTRNDWRHGTDAAFTDKITFEKWTEENLPSISMARGFVPDWNQIFGQKGDSQAPIPISRLIDMNVYQPGERPNITRITTAGIAEYSNSNFLSSGTIFKGYAYPSKDSTEPMIGEPYWSKVKDGQQINYFVRHGGLDQTESFQLDPKCHEDYAEKLVPKAVAYASLIPDYFFRGLLFTFSVGALPDKGNDLYVFNFSSEPLENGKLEVYRQEGYPDRYLYPVGTFDIGYLQPSTECLEYDLWDCPYFEIHLDPPGCHHHTVVFRGKLGQEEDAVIGSMSFGGGCAW